MANDVLNRRILDQLTAAATSNPAPGADPSLPSSLAAMGAVPEGAAVPPSLVPATGSTEDLESIASSPETLASNVASTAKTEKDAHPGFLATLGRVASGATGLTDPNSSPQAGMGAKIASLAGRVGNGLAVAAGTPEQKQIGEENSQVPLKLAQLQNEQDYRKALVGNAAQKNAISEEKNDITRDKNDEQSLLTDAKVPNVQIDTEKKQFELEAMKNGMFPVDAVTANLVNRPDLAGKPVSATLWKGMNSVLQARGLHPVDLAQEGLWILDKAGNKVHQISELSPSMARGQAYGANRPVQALDPTDNTVKYMTAGKAEALGAAPAGAGAQIMSKQAQFKDIYSGIGNMRAAINGIGNEPLDAATIGKLTMAMRETDPTVFHQAVDTILGTENLSPAQQDFIIATQQLNERALSLRNLAGMGNGSDQVRAAIRATLPSAKSGDAAMMRKQLDAVTNLVDNLHTGVPNIKSGTSAPGATGPLTLQEAQAYLQRAGGDANKARAAAKQDGRSF